LDIFDLFLDSSVSLLLLHPSLFFQSSRRIHLFCSVSKSGIHPFWYWICFDLSVFKLLHLSFFRLP
jgi:hypothetical protein